MYSLANGSQCITQYYMGAQSNKRDNQSLLKAKYCPRVAAASCTHKKKQKKW